MNRNVVGIRSISVYVPQEIRDSSWIASESGIPEEVIRNKFGIKQIHKANSEESVSDMAIAAAKRALKGVNPAKIDLLIYCGSEYKDYYLYNIAAKIQNAIGAINAESFEIHSLCSAGVYSLKVAKNILQCDAEKKMALLVTSSKEADLINYKDNDSRFMFNFGDGAAAILLEKDYDENVVLETKMISDGQFAEDVYVSAVGCNNFSNIKEAKKEDFYLKVTNISDMKERLDPVTIKNFFTVIEDAIKKSGYTNQDIDFIAPLFMKKSISDEILKRFNLKSDNTFLLEKYGHCQSADVFISITEGLKLGRINNGDIVVLVSAGTGYTWAATVVKWGK